ncbi:MAG TPA: NAD(P)H-binding protein [Kineosporiaceae bacterium]
MRIAVAGGTGVVGRWVVRRLEQGGHQTVVLSRRHGVDLTTATGLDGALAGCSAIIDVSNVATNRRRAAEEFFGTVTGHLLRAGERAGVGHLVALSIVGIDRVGFGYYAGKRRQEAVLAAGPLPWTVLRATQFHEFAGQFLDRVRGPVVPVPRLLSQPVAAAEVAGRLVELVVGPAQAMAPPIAGPDVLQLPDMVRRVLRVRGSRRRVVPVPLPGAAGRAARAGALLPDGPCQLGAQTFAEFVRAGAVTPEGAAEPRPAPGS